MTMTMIHFDLAASIFLFIIADVEITLYVSHSGVKCNPLLIAALPVILCENHGLQSFDFVHSGQWQKTIADSRSHARLGESGKLAPLHQLQLAINTSPLHGLP